MYLTSRGLNVRIAALNCQHKVSRSAYTLKHARLRPSIYFERQISLTYMEVSEIQVCYPLGHTSYGSLATLAMKMICFSSCSCRS